MNNRAFQSLEWRLLGPHRGGRVVAVAGHPIDQGTFYFGACAGGVWMTTNAGSHWDNISDGFFNTSAIGALAVSRSDPNVIYAGTGETSIRNNISHGDGVYRSSDGGRVWTNVGLADTRYIGEIEIHPGNPDLVYVAALGHAWGRNPERGVYRTTDGGSNWEQILFKSERAGAVDISMDRSNPRVLFASIWQAQRFPHALSTAGEDSGIWRTLDGGDTWQDISGNPGLPAGIWGKCGVTVSPARPGRVWAQIEARPNALYRSDDYGDTWTRVNDEPKIVARPWYYMHIFADPADGDTLWIADQQLWKSTDAGVSFNLVPTPHADTHDLWIDPNNPQRMINGNDGGACVSLDGGRSWSTILNQPTAQFYHVETDNQFPYNVYGSQQDNYAMRLPSSDIEGAISWNNYWEPGGGESGYIRVQPEEPHIVFAGGTGTGFGHGRLVAWNPVTRQRRNVTIWPESHGMRGVAARDLKYRFNWTFPIEFSPHQRDVLYTCSNVVHRSADLGHSWEVISPDLTRNDPEKLGPPVGPLTPDAGQSEFYCTIFAFVESAHEPGVFWAGSDDGLVHLSRDGGNSWANVTPPDLPDWALISMIEASPHGAASAYVAATMYKHDDMRPYLFKTSDYGETWSRIESGIPEHDFTRVVREDPERAGLLYAGTETGVYVSLDDGGSWHRLEGLPVAPVYDLVVKDGDLVVATHGRSFWILDDLSPLRQLNRETVSKRLHLFEPPDVYALRNYGRASNLPEPNEIGYMASGPTTVSYRRRADGSGNVQRQFLDAGSNPPEGVVFHYWLDASRESEIMMRIFDKAGVVVIRFSNQCDQAPWLPKREGANRFVWNLRGKGSIPLEGDQDRDRRIAAAENVLPPRVPPGTYRAEMTVGSDSSTVSFQVFPDPRLEIPHEDLEAQYEMKVAIRDLVSDISQAVNDIRSMRRQIESWIERAGTVADASTLVGEGKRLVDELISIENSLVQLDRNAEWPDTARLRGKLVTLSAMIDESDAAPTQGAQEVFVKLSTDTKHEMERLERFRRDDISAFEEQLSRHGIPAVSTGM